MKAIVQDAYGSSDVLSLRDIPEPTPKRGEVLIRVRAAGVNWADRSIVQGLPLVMRVGYGLRRPRSRVRGSDVAGTVEAVGADVERLRPGDEVFGVARGAFAEVACASADKLVGKPADLGFESAAAVPMAGLCALQAVRDVGRVQPGHEVLINGASGGIGSFAVQIAKSFGAEVTGVCSTGNVDLVRSLGADHVIDYTQEDFTRGTTRYDLILDIVDDRSIRDRRRVLTRRGTLIPNSGSGGRWFGSVGRIVRARLSSPFVPQRLRPFLSLPKRDDLETLKDLLAAGTVTPVVGRTFPLVDAGTAIEHAGAGHARGKVVLTM